MKNLTGITLNGEWLGNNVLINGMFREICSISPVVMQEFIHIVNGIDELENAVSIQKFNCKDKNSIDIEFANRDLKGLASLYFAMDEGSTPELINSFLKLDRNEDNVYEANTANAMEMLEDSVSDKQGRKSKKKSRRKSNKNSDVAGEYSDDNEFYSEENYDEEYYDGGEQEVSDNYESQNENYDNAYDMKSEYQPGSYDCYACDGDEAVYQDSIQNNRGSNQEAYQDSNSVNEEMYTDDNNGNNNDQEAYYEEAKNSSRRHIYENSNLDENNQSEYSSDEDNDEENGSTEGRRKSLPASGRSSMQNQRNMRAQNVNGRRGGAQPNMPAAQGRGQGRVTATSDLQQIVITASSININPSDFEPGARNSSRNRGTNNIDESKSRSGRDTNTDNIENNSGENCDSSISENYIENYYEPARETKPAGSIIIPEIINENYNPEDISEFLADFYTSDKIEAEITREQALLNEIASLKEEINSLHGQHRNPEEEEETPMTLEEFYARQLKKRESKANTYGYTFRIVGTNKRLRANVVDSVLFIAGDKLYKWGEKLYLEN